MLDKLKLRARTLKPFWFIHNLLHWRTLRRNKRLYEEQGVGKSVFATISHRDFPSDAEEGPWLDRSNGEGPGSPPAGDELPPELAELIPGWVENGFIVLKQHFDPELIAAVVEDVDRQLAEGTMKPHFRGQQVVRDSYVQSEPVRRVLTDPAVGRLLNYVFGRPARLFQTIDFFAGSQQPLHSDAFHMTTQPPGYLTGGWVALEDVAADAGPVYYLPGSHRLPYVMSEDLGLASSGLSIPLKDDVYANHVQELADEAGLEPVDFLARKGDMLIWHHNLLHGGRPVEREGSTRRSLVAHYFADDVICYHEVTERPAILDTSVPLPA
jgi:ectoine hydroxylase